MNLKQSALTAALAAAMTLIASQSLLAQPDQGMEGMQDAPMNPMMMQMMKRRQKMMQGAADDDYGMGGMNMHRRHHMMMQRMMEKRMQGRGAGPRGGMGMMRPQMMQQKTEHMQAMEERLGKIESLLQELVELQKKQ